MSTPILELWVAFKLVEYKGVIEMLKKLNICPWEYVVEDRDSHEQAPRWFELELSTTNRALIGKLSEPIPC